MPPTAPNTNAVRQAAKDLLGNRSRHRTEGNVQSGVEALLRAMQPGTLESQYQTGVGPADIYLPNRRVFVETKGYPKAADPESAQAGRDESAADQLTRYVHAEIDRELGMLPLGDETEGLWRGIVTDGTNWHAWEFRHRRNAKRWKLEPARFISEAEGDALVAWLERVVGVSSVGKEWVPPQPGALFTDLKAEHDVLYGQVPARAKAARDTKRGLWLDMMRASGMVPDDEAGQRRLFLAHSFLIAIVRLVAHALSGDPVSEWKSALRDGFASWTLDFERGRKWAEVLRSRVVRYDWRRRRSDVLRELYQHYVPAEDRKVFGEFYTPDWLAALMVEAVCDEPWIERSLHETTDERKPGVGLLDPACGSGTFLYHAALRIVESKPLRGMRPAKKADVAARLLNGIDIHPVAAEISRVNIMRALPQMPLDGDSALNVYLGDSLQVHRRDDLFASADEMRLTSPRGSGVSLPMTFVRNPSFHEHMRQMVNAAATGEPLPRALSRLREGERLVESHKQLTRVIRKEGNSVWTWYAVNIAGPHLLAERKVDRVVANPPWVKLSDIQVRERKRAMEALGTAMGLQGGGKQAPHLDIAQFFVLRARELYAADPHNDVGAWLVKASALRAGHWSLFRDEHARVLSQSVDLVDLQPFGGGDATRSCILLERSKLPRVRWKQAVAKRIGLRPKSEASLAEARRGIRFVLAPKPLKQGRSAYQGKFRNGATIFPRVLSVVARKTSTGRPGWARVETTPSIHKPWKVVKPQRGVVPERWLRPLLLSEDVLPYALREPCYAILPFDKHGRFPDARARSVPLWRELEEWYDVHRGIGRSTPETLQAQFDYAGKLSAQPTTRRQGWRMVVYPSSGDHMRAGRAREGSVVVENTLFWAVFSSGAEAAFVTALLNAPCLGRAFAESRESGRHFHLHPWSKVPVPAYDRRNADHRELGRLCNEAERIASSVVDEALAERPGRKQVALTKAVRDTLAETETGTRIDHIAARLLPDQAG